MHKYLDFYKHFFPTIKLGDSEEIAVKCCFHNDHSPSLYLNVANGTYHCKVCDDEATGGAADWLQQFYGIRIYDALNIVEKYQATGKLVVTADLDKIITMHNTLTDPAYQAQYKELMQKRLFMPATIEEYLIGWDEATGRYSIPIPAQMPEYYRGQQHYMTVRYYGMKKPANVKKFSKMIYKNDSTKGFAKSYFFPINDLSIATSEDDNYLVLFEGEADAMLAQQMEINALTCTGGVNTWPKPATTKQDKYNQYDLFSTYDRIYICFDDDDAGRSGAQKQALKLLPYNEEVYICSYNTAQKGFDFTDYVTEKAKQGVRSRKQIKEDFVNEILATSASKFESAKEQLEKDNAERIAAQEQEIAETTYKNVLNDRLLHNSRVRFDARMGAILNKRMTAPKRVRIYAEYYSETDAASPATMIGRLTEEEILEGIELDLPIDDSILEFIGADQNVHEMLLKRLFNVPLASPMYKLEILEHYYVSIAQIVPKADEMSAKNDDSILSFVLQSDTSTVSEGDTYTFTAIKTVNPKDSSVTLLVTDYLKAFDDIEGFEPTVEELEELKVFQVAAGQTVKEKMHEIATDLSRVTRIWGRSNIITAYDLVYHSPLKFKFGGKKVDRGWLDILVIGDSRTGKTETAERLQEHYQLGEKFTAESASIAGLTGGVDSVTGIGGSGKHIVRWGKFPLNDKRLLVVDEMSGLAKDEIGRLSNIRSQGVVEISKIVGNTAKARVRTIWISNPRNGNGGNSYMSDKAYGVQAIIDLIGASEDVARFDFAMGVGQDDVSSELVNDPTLNSLPDTPAYYTHELCHRLILWAWSRNLADGNYDDILFEEGTEFYLLQKAQEVTSLYRYNQAMLIDPSSFKEKLARIAISAAARVFSTNEDMSKVVVKQEHIDFALEFLDDLYSSNSLRYKALAIKERDAKMVTNEQAVKMIKVVSYLDKMYKHKVSNMLESAGGKLLTEGAFMLATGSTDIEETRSNIATLEEAGVVEVQYGANSGRIRSSRKWSSSVMPHYIALFEEYGYELDEVLKTFDKFAD